MVKLCLMALALGLGATARAVMVAWTVPAQSDWFLQPENVDVYLVSSQTGEGWSASSGEWETDRSANSNWTSIKLQSSGKALNYGSLIGDSGTAGIWTDIGNSLTDGFYYSLVFVVKPGEDAAGHYAITQGKQYTGVDEQGKGANGYYVTTIGGNEGPPPWVDFVDSDWIFTNVQGTPEPTALALLAFGLAGLALRRRVSL